MIKQIRASYYNNFKNAQYCALSTDIDSIPDYLNNGDQVYIIDTGKSFIYNEAAGKLVEEPTFSVLSGGLENQVLVKNTNKDYDITWKTITGATNVEFTVDGNGILNVVASSL